MKRNHLHAFVFGILIAVFRTSFAETPPPTAPFDTYAWKASMNRKPSTGISMGSFRIRFENTTLDDVRRASSVGAIAHRGDAGESAYWLCYTDQTPTSAERVWIISHGEMGGSEHYVTNVSAEVLPNGRVTADCPALPDCLKPLSLDNGLWLGMSESIAHTKFGAPSKKKGAWRSYDFQGKVPGNCEGGGFDLLAWLLLYFQNGRINSLQVGQVTSC